MTSPHETTRFTRRSTRRSTRRATLVGAVLLAIVLAGCGTRLPVSQQGGNGGGALVGTGSGGSGTNGASALNGTTTGSTLPGANWTGPGTSGAGQNAVGLTGTGGGSMASAGGVSGSTGGGSSGTGVGSGGPARSGGSAGSGKGAVTASGIKIGYMYSDTATFSAFSSACSACATFGDQTWYPSMFTVLANDVNSHGGILGHKVTFVGYPYNSTSAATDSSQLSSISQAACQNFTADNPVFAVITALGSVISPCLSKAGVSTISPNGAIEDTIDNSSLGSSLLYEPAVTDTNDFMTVFVHRMAAQGFFSGWNTTTGSAGVDPLKIGVVSFSDPEFVHTDQYMIQALTAAGYRVTDHISYSAELDTQSQNVQNAILKFRADGITHVMGTGANGLFMYESVGQNYFPRYAYMSGSVSDTDQDANRGMAGSMGEGVNPVADIDPNQNPPSVGALQTTCEKFGTQAGVGWQSSQSFHADLLSVCDSVWDLEDALIKGQTLTAQGLANGFNALGTIQSPSTFYENWSSNRHASAGEMEDFQFMASCSCFRYTGVKTPF